MKGLKDISSSHRSLKETSDDYVRLTFKRVTEDDVGTYCILAKNIHGCDRAFFTVRLRYRARSATPTGEGFSLRNRLTYQERYHLRGEFFSCRKHVICMNYVFKETKAQVIMLNCYGKKSSGRF